MRTWQCTPHSSILLFHLHPLPTSLLATNLVDHPWCTRALYPNLVVIVDPVASLSFDTSCSGLCLSQLLQSQAWPYSWSPLWIHAFDWPFSRLATVIIGASIPVACLHEELVVHRLFVSNLHCHLSAWLQLAICNFGKEKKKNSE